MERLTHRRKSDGEVCANIEESKVLTDFPAFTQKVYERLAAYEDMMERWAFREINDIDILCQRVNSLGGTDKMATYKQAETNGRLISLPCKVGDTLYETIFGKCCYFVSTFIVPDIPWILENQEQIGKTIFFSFEEAEAALAKETDNA